MSRKLAIAISGAVSLGSYEAGVMYEVLEAIAKHNEKPATEDSDRIEIDVITGASAGGMTAGILAQKLLCDGQSLRKPYSNPLYKSWIEEVDIAGLLSKPRREYKFSLLSSRVVESIGNKYIESSPAIKKKHPSVATEIYVGIAMSNLNGWDYTVKPHNVEGNGEFTYTRHKDHFVCRLSEARQTIKLSEMSLLYKEDAIDEWMEIHPPKEQKELEIPEKQEKPWERLRKCSLSSGAFPFAFEAMKIDRYPGKGEFAGRKANAYTYTDGGVFENEPLGLAKKLAEWLDEKARLTGSDINAAKENIKHVESSRVYLYVAPGHKTSTANTKFGRSEGVDVDLWTTFQALISAIFHQSRFQDWIIKDLDSTSPIYQITVQDKNLIGELLFAFAGFLDIRFRHYDYNIGRESARKALDEFSKKKTGNSSNPNLVYWKNIEDDFIWECTPSDKNKKIAINKKYYKDIAANTSIEKLLAEVDLEKRKVIYKALMARVMALIDFVNEKLDEEDKKKLLGFVFRIVRGIWTCIGLKPIVWLLARGFLRRKLLFSANEETKNEEI